MTPFIALVAWVTLTHTLPAFPTGDFRGIVAEHGLPCTPAVVVSTTNPFIRPWVGRVDAFTYEVQAENLGIPPTVVEITAHAFCFGPDPAFPSLPNLD